MKSKLGEAGCGESKRGAQTNEWSSQVNLPLDRAGAYGLVTPFLSCAFTSNPAMILEF